MKVITLETTKALLGITDTSQDDAINAQLPLMDATVKQICGNNFNLQVYGKFISGSKTVQVYDTGYNCRKQINTWPSPELDALTRDLNTGTLIEGEAITPVGRIDEVFYEGNSRENITVPSFHLNTPAIASGDLYFYAGINIAYQKIIAKGIWYNIGQVSQVIDASGWKSRNVGPLSVTKSEMDAKIDGKYGMPSWFVKSLPRYHS